MMRTFALLVALLATAMAEGAAASACDGAICGMGACKEVPPALPALSNVSTYECDCYPGWGNLVPFVTLTPCFIPKCPLGGLSCYVPGVKIPPPGSNSTLHPCLATECGPGTCVEEPLRCQCNQGAVNLLGNPSFPCTNEDCIMDKDGCKVQNPPPSPPPPPPSSAPPGNDNGSSGSIAPSTTKGSVCAQNLLLLAVLAALHVVVG